MKLDEGTPHREGKMLTNDLRCDAAAGQGACGERDASCESWVHRRQKSEGRAHLELMDFLVVSHLGFFARGSVCVCTFACGLLYGVTFFFFLIFKY